MPARVLDGPRLQVLVVRPDDARTVAGATARLLWGTCTGAAVWSVMDAVRLPSASLLAWAIAAAVAVFGLAGVVVCAAAALAFAASASPVPAIIAGAIAVSGAVVAGPARWAGRRCGGLPVDLMCAVAAMGVVAFGMLGAFLTPAGVAAIRIVVRRPGD